jgi:hypothetical protein
MLTFLPHNFTAVSGPGNYGTGLLWHSIALTIPVLPVSALRDRHAREP